MGSFVGIANKEGTTVISHSNLSKKKKNVPGSRKKIKHPTGREKNSSLIKNLMTSRGDSIEVQLDIMQK